MNIKDRVVELRRVKASELKPHPKNWRFHPPSQRAALRGVLREVGFAGVILARQVRGKYQIIDGHLRQEEAGDEEVPVLILDVTAKEAELLLATYDPLSAAAEADQEKLHEILTIAETSNQDVRDFLDAIEEKTWPDGIGGGGVGGNLHDDPHDDNDLADTQATIGEYRFTIERSVYESWVEDIRQDVGFDHDSVVAEIKLRLKL